MIRESERAAGDTAMHASVRLVRALREVGGFPHATENVELIETHISWVLLTGAYAYKIKKPLRLPFLDFSTLELRRRFCEEELRLNRRLAPQLYLDVVPIGGRSDAPEVGSLPAIEYAVKLRQFDPTDSADRKLERKELSAAEVEALAERIAKFHAGLSATTGASIGQLARDNLDELEKQLQQAGYTHFFGNLRDFIEAQYRSLGETFEQRARAGAIREGHGDLHLENLVVVNGEILPFDALEFDAAMRSVDVIDETAFLVMDLMAHARNDFALQFLNRYLEVTGDYGGMRLLRFYLVYRALVRAKVRAIKAAQPHAERSLEDSVAPYLRLAENLIRPVRPLLLITHGLSGSGKTTVTDTLIPRLPALRLRSDLERKRIAGVDASDRAGLGVGEGRYRAEMTHATYQTLARGAADALSAGIDTIVDATFLERARRREFAELAARAGARFAILDCGAPERVLRQRIRTRAAARSDASEADETVLDAQLRHADPIDDGEAGCTLRVDTSTEIDYESLCAALSERI